MIPEVDENGDPLPPKEGHPPTYVPPGSNMVSASELAASYGEIKSEEDDDEPHDPNEDPTARAARLLQKSRAKAMEEDDMLATLDEPAIEDIIHERINTVDTGSYIRFCS